MNHRYKCKRQDYKIPRSKHRRKSGTYWVCRWVFRCHWHSPWKKLMRWTSLKIKTSSLWILTKNETTCHQLGENIGKAYLLIKDQFPTISKVWKRSSDSTTWHLLMFLQLFVYAPYSLGKSLNQDQIAYKIMPSVYMLVIQQMVVNLNWSKQFLDKKAHLKE